MMMMRRRRRRRREDEETISTETNVKPTFSKNEKMSSLRLSLDCWMTSAAAAAEYGDSRYQKH